MRILPVVLLCFPSMFCSAQLVEDIYNKPLKEVLTMVEKSHRIVVKYNERDVKDLTVRYAMWRFNSDVQKTLENILNPLDLSFTRIDSITYQISQYEYYRRSEEEGRKHLDRLLSDYGNADEFNKRKTQLRHCIFKALGINPSARRTPLHPVIRAKKQMDGYSVENIAFESIPGYLVTGTLYRPVGRKGPYPVILSPHGHFYNDHDRSIPQDSGRYRPDMQYRCAALAKMGAIVLNYDMYAWGESALQTGSHDFHRTGFALSMQTWNSIRALDYLLTLPDADTSRVAVTGASGGGTQTILLAALDDRISVSVPVVMVSSSFYGGCPCESGLPIHDACEGKQTNNTEIAAMHAPRPLLLVSDGSDWTKSVPGTDYPYLKKIYGFFARTANLESVYLPDDKHDYGITKRVPMYRFMAKHLSLNLKAITAKDGNISEKGITIQNYNDLRVFRNEALPKNTLRSHTDIMRSFSEVHRIPVQE